MATPRWLPLESNPELYTKWSKEMGLDTSNYAFTDIYGLDEDLLAFVPQPVKAVLLLFPITKAYEERRMRQNEELAGSQFGSELMYFKQTIGNACGTIGLLHALGNAGVPLVQGGHLQKLFDQCQPLSPAERGKFLETSKELEATHAATASAGQSQTPDINDDTDLHFAAFVESNGHLVELDGRNNSPVDRGSVKIDLLHSVVDQVRELINISGDSINFNLIALSPAQE